MAAPKKDTPLRSPLLSALNNIVSINRSKSAMRSTQSSYNEFLRFMSVEVKNLEAIKLPDERKVKKLANINVASTFGSAGSLLSGLASGALDAGGLVGDFFGGRKKNPRTAKPIPKGTKIRLPGVRGLPIISTALAGLDFASGIAQGESVGKAGAGALGSAAGAAGGALAGSALAGVIGQALVPIPGLGFVLGAAVGSLGGMAGGYLADRAYEAVTGEGKVKEKTKARLKEQEQKQKIEAASLTALTFPQVLDKFDGVVTQFQKAAERGLLGPTGNISGEKTTDEEGAMHEDVDPRTDGGENPYGDGEQNEYSVTGGELPSKYVNTPDYGERRPQGHTHAGEDYPIKQGTPISLVVPGTVAQAQFSNDAAGGNILITHEDGSQTRYLHMTEIYVRPGEKISSGKVIGLTGGEPGTKGAGRSSGPHLHFEYYKTTKSGPSDPKPHADKYFRFGGNVTVKKKVTSQTGVMGQNGAPTVVLAAGTNTYGDPKKAAADVKRSVEELKKKGYNVVVVPPSEQGVYGNVSKAVQQAATESGATIEKGRYDPNDPTRAYTHLDPNEAKRIREKYKGATFMGDSNAVRIAGGFDVAGLRVTGAQTDTIAGFAKDMKSSGVSPSSQVQGLSQQPVAAQRLQQYPTYNTPQNSVTIVPMMMGGGGGGSQQRPMVISSGEGGGTTIMPPVPQGQVLNSLFNTMLLTNLSGS